MRGDAAAQVSFSLIATVLLLSTVAAGAYLADREMDAMAQERLDAKLEAMEAAVSEVSLELTLCAAERARTTVSGWDSFPVNHSEISDAFSVSVEHYVETAFPDVRMGFTVAVGNWTGGLYFVEMNAVDLAPDDTSAGGSLAIDGATMEYDDMGSSADEVPVERTVNPYYFAVGNFTVAVSDGSASVSRSCSFERPIISALPFLESKLRAFESSSFGESSDLGKLVGYMLTTLAQLRAIEGYGTPIYSGLETDGILTEEDVYRAVLVGLLLEQARLFRTVDEGFASDVAGECGGGEAALKALLGSAGRYLDPSELFLWFLGKTSVSIDPRIVVSQAVNGLADQLAVKFLDYMGFLGMLDVADRALDAVSDSIDSLICYLTGEDEAQGAVVAWVKNALYSVNADPSLYSELFSGTGDCRVFVPERTYFVEDAAGGLIPVWIGNSTVQVDLPTYDITTSPVWRDFYDTFKEHQQSARGLVMDSVARLAYDIATQTAFSLDGFVVDPTDDVDLFTTLSSRAGDITFAIDPEELGRSVRWLPMFSQQYEMASELADFALMRTGDLFGEGIVDAATADLAASLLADARYPYSPDLVVPVEQQLFELVANDLAHDVVWGVSESVRSAVDRVSRSWLQAMLNAVNMSVTESDDGFCGPLVDSIAAALVTGLDGFPGLGRAAEDQIRSYATAVLAQRKLSAQKTSVYLDLGGSFAFWEGDLSSAAESGLFEESLSVDVLDGIEPLTVVPYDPGRGYDGLGNLIPVDEVLVQLRRPWQFDRSQSDYPNSHLTSLLDVSATPYTTQWTVSVRGQLDLVVSAEGTDITSMLADGPVVSERSIGIDLCIPVVVHSATPLAGVEYNPTNTVASDALAAARAFCDLVWDKLEPVVGWVRDGLDRVLWFLRDFFDVVASFATRLVKTLAAGLQVLVETMQGYIARFAESVLGEAVKLLIDITGTIEVQISLYGFILIIQTNVPDLLFKDSKDLLRVMVHTRRFGPGITFGVRVARLSDGRYDLIVNGTVATDEFTAEVVVDPMMMVKRRLVELHLVAKSWKLDLTMPEVEPYDLAEVSTSDLAGVSSFLSRIPIPVLGLSAAVELGMRVKYSPPFPTNLVVNEFEANPAGDDDGREWAEVYNPLDRAVDLSGWRLETTHGGVHAIDLGGRIAPGGFAVFTFPRTSIDNGMSGDPFNNGDALVLVDPGGAVVDMTPTLADTANDGRTHQRNWDGGPKWYLRPATRADSNGVPLFRATSDYVAKALFEAVKEALEETKTVEVTASMEFLKLLGRRIIDNFVDNLLDMVKEILHEVVFYIEVTVNDATGTAGFGFRTSFVVKGEAVAEILKWLVKALATYMVNLGRASNPIEYPASPEGFFSNLHIRFEAMFTLGMPRMLTALGGRVDLDRRVEAVVSVAPNIPAIGRLMGREWGMWSVEFGACLEGIPREVVGNTIVTASGDLVDVWLVRAEASGL